MKKRALMAFTMLSLIGTGAVLSVNAQPAPHFITVTTIITEDRIVGSAYYDALSILKARNSCSDFFGGSSVSLEVFEGFVRRLRRDHYPVSVGVRMSGSITSVLNERTKTSYRLFEKVSINKNGPFYRSTASKSEPDISRIGRFRPNSREIRVLMLLHELGHLLKGAEGNWLLPDDGNDAALSRANSEKVDEVCGVQIKELSRSFSVKKHLKPAQPRETLARVSTTAEPRD